MKHTRSKAGTERPYTGPAVQPPVRRGNWTTYVPAPTRDVPAPQVGDTGTPAYTAIRFFRADRTHYDVLAGTHMTPEERAAVKAQGATRLAVQHGEMWYMHVDLPAVPAPRTEPEIVGHMVAGQPWYVDGRRGK
jgi:hypothetical protein